MYDMLALYEAKDVQDAVRLRLEHPEAQIIAGGTDVLVQMREGKRAGKALISIQKCDEMRGISIDEEENIRIGSLTSFTHITNDPIIQKYINVLGEAVDMVGGPQIRNAGTIGGNTCNGVTSADSASTLHAWEAIVEITGKNGVRRIPIKEFYLKAGTVDLKIEDGEIQTAILIPKASYDRTWGHYIKYAMRNAMDIATLGTSVNARLSPDGKTFERVRIAFGVAGPVPMRAVNAEAFINGKAVTLENIEAFGRKVLEDINPRDSWRASKAFRSHIAVESAKRCLIESVKLAGYSHVVYVKNIEKGRGVSYGQTFVADKPMTIATIPVGYGDGYPRNLSNKGYVLINGKKCNILGRVCMDQFMVDVTGMDVKEGDKVTLAGKDGSEEILIDDLAALAGTFNYEFVCDLGKRVPRVFVKDGKIVGTKDYFEDDYEVEI